MRTKLSEDGQQLYYSVDGKKWWTSPERARAYSEGRMSPTGQIIPPEMALSYQPPPEVIQPADINAASHETPQSCPRCHDTEQKLRRAHSAIFELQEELKRANAIRRIPIQEERYIMEATRATDDLRALQREYDKLELWARRHGWKG